MPSPREKITRRSLLQSAVGGAMLGAWGLSGKTANLCWGAETTSKPAIKIAEPFHGAILDHRHGKQSADSMTIHVTGQANSDGPVTINGMPARREGTKFEAEVILRESETDLIAVVGVGENLSKDRVRVVWDRHSVPRYRFAIDDVSFVFRDIAEKNYRSLFDCFFLKNLRDLNKKYGTKFVLNCYYVTADGTKLPGPNDFTLPQFPDRYKGEWKDNASWLKLAFHARANRPVRPYQDATSKKIIEDMKLVDDEIRRFAGEETYTPTTCIHFGMLSPDAFKPLYKYGVRVLSTDFYHRPPPKPLRGKWDINLELSDEISEYCSSHDAWKDFDSGMIVSMVDIVCDKTKVKDVDFTLRKQVHDPLRSEVMDLFTHEQFFWPFFPDFIPDHFERVEAAIRFVTEHKYQSVFFHEGLLGGRV